MTGTSETIETPRQLRGLPAEGKGRLTVNTLIQCLMAVQSGKPDYLELTNDTASSASRSQVSPGDKSP
jgi:hypothetical protein